MTWEGGACRLLSARVAQYRPVVGEDGATAACTPLSHVRDSMCAGQYASTLQTEKGKGGNLRLTQSSKSKVSPAPPPLGLRPSCLAEGIGGSEESRLGKRAWLTQT